jgi:UrcA family protein
MSTKAALRHARSVLGAATLACALFAGNVAAKEHAVIVTIHVSTHGLDLSLSPGAHEFYARLQHAAWVACTHANRVDLAPSLNPQGCYEKALGDAIRSADVPLLTQVYLNSHSIQEAAARGIGVPPQTAAK